METDLPVGVGRMLGYGRVEESETNPTRLY